MVSSWRTDIYSNILEIQILAIEMLVGQLSSLKFLLYFRISMKYSKHGNIRGERGKCKTKLMERSIFQKCDS